MEKNHQIKDKKFQSKVVIIIKTAIECHNHKVNDLQKYFS